MKSLAKIMAVVGLAALCSGYIYGEHQKAVYRASLTEHKVVEHFHTGDTVDEILREYHNEMNEGVSFHEFRYNTLRLKENAHLLNSKGGLKLVQVGEKITIVFHCKDIRK